jgi:hypothetical protein
MSVFGRRGLRGAFTTAAITLTLLACAAVAQAQCGEDYHGAPTSSDVPGGPPLAIGDSVLADAVPVLVRDGFEADGMVCRQMSQGIELLEQRSPDLPRLVVLALGTNGEVTAQQIDRVLTILGPGRLLALVTPHGSVDPSSADVIRAAARSQPRRIILLEWDRIAEDHRSWLAPDGIHLGGQAGIEGYAQMIATALPYAAGVQGLAHATRPQVQSSEPTGTEPEQPGEPTGEPTTLQLMPQSRKESPDHARRVHPRHLHPPNSKAVGRAHLHPPRSTALMPVTKPAPTGLAEKSRGVTARASAELSVTDTAIVVGAALLAVLVAMGVRRRRNRE